MGMEVIVKKDNWAKIRANLSLAKKSYVAVGWPGEANKTKLPHDISGMSNVQVATINEIGSAPGVSPQVPARPMVAETVKRTRGQVKELQKAGIKGITEGTMSAKIALEQIGRFFQGELIESIRMSAGDWKAANAPSTIARKKSETPLVNTGNLSQSVSWVVRMRSANQKHAWDAETQRRRAAQAAQGTP